MIELQLVPEDPFKRMGRELAEDMRIELGIPKDTQKRALQAFGAMPDDESTDSIEETSRRIALRFTALERLGAKLVNGQIPSLIVSGPPGLGKSFTLDRELAKTCRARFNDAGDPVEDASGMFDHISGGCSAPGLFQSLWHMRNGGVLLIDDCDAIFYDEVARNLLKIATDSSKSRVLSWRKEAEWLYARRISRTFDFKGHIAFLTNIDFEQVIKKQNKDTDHFKALIDRSRYLCLTIRTQRDFMIRIRQVAINEQMLSKDHGLTLDDAESLVQYIEENKHRFYNLSLRLVGHIADDMRDDPEHWQENVETTKMRTED